MTDKLLFRLVAAVSVFVTLVVVVLNRKLLPAPVTPPDFIFVLPRLNAFLNGTCSILLLLSLYFIKQKNIGAHKRINLLAFALSAIFLVSYIVFHYFAPETVFGDQNHDGVLSKPEQLAVGEVRTVYLTILVSHIILAVAVLPLILLSFYRGLQLQVERHKKLVRWTFPIWLYVTLTGVIVYLMISPYYNF